MKIAILYQQNKPPIINGIQKPMKPGGYSDSGADIAFCLRSNGTDVITPVSNPAVQRDMDWVFPDTADGIESALRAGADTLWLNTVLYKGHPIEQFKGVFIIGHQTADVDKYDDKYAINQLLRQDGFPAVEEQLIGIHSDYSGQFPCILKPIRGRGSQGVVKCCSKEEFDFYKKLEIEKGIFGDRLMAEEFLDGKEITISVFPDGFSLPIVERFNHCNGIAPYNGDVPVIENSRVITRYNEELQKIKDCCETAVKKLSLRGLVRIDCRADESGKYKMFDFNLKPNLTGAVRPHRMNQNCLTMIAAEALGWSYFDLLKKMTETRWML